MGQEDDSDLVENNIEEVEPPSFSFENIGELLGKIFTEPEFIHYAYLKDTYENEKYSLVIILLSTFFESFLTSELKIAFKKMQAERKTKGSRDFLDDINFERKLKLARILGILDDNQFDIINQVRDARNDFAHGIESYGVPNRRKILQDVRIEEAMKLYEKYSKASNSNTE